MRLLRLEITNVRNISHLCIDTSPRLNAIYGANGSGKTSLLEGIYLLSCGRSFRSSRLSSIIQNGQKIVRVTGLIDHPRRGKIPIGIERQGKEVRIRLQGQSVENLSELALSFPVQVFSPWSHRVVEDGPKLRRRFLDWGVFHIEADFHVAWKRYQRALRQRNAALRMNPQRNELIVWEQEMDKTASQIDDYRKRYITALADEFSLCLAQILPTIEIQIQYERGWSVGQRLAEVLASSLPGDRRCGYTQHGPQRADFQLKWMGVQAQNRLSRGQQKAMLLALHLAQSELMAKKLDVQPVLLLDDLGSELDIEAQHRVLNMLSARAGQTFVTLLNRDLEDSEKGLMKAWFHMKEGQI